MDPRDAGPPTGACRFRNGVLRLALAIWLGCMPATVVAEVLWSDPDARVIHQTPVGDDILGGVIARDDTASDALYFTFQVDPASDRATEEYRAGFQLFQDGEPRLAVGNAPAAWGYSAYHTSEMGEGNKREGEFDLNSSRPEGAAPGRKRTYELPQLHEPRTIVFKVQYVPGGDDLITVWLSPNLGRGDTEANQPETLTTRFKADASFNEIRLCHEGGGNGWTFSDMAIATSFDDFLVIRFWESWWFTALAAFLLLGGAVLALWAGEKRKYQRQLRIAEQESVVERERARIARDLHDELGSSLARISLMSNLVRLDKDDPAQVEAHAAKLVHSADQTVRALEEIVWAVRSGSDSVQGLIDYIAHFANEMSDEKTILCRLDLPSNLPARSMAPEVRHNIFLVVKEAITNALKHAAAQEVHIAARVQGDLLEIEVRDTGRGFAPETVGGDGDRNGLRNMRKRAESIGARLEVETTPGQGTTVRISSSLGTATGDRQAGKRRA